MYFRPFTGAPISLHILWFDARDEDLVVGLSVTEIELQFLAGPIDPTGSEPPRPFWFVCLKGATERGKKKRTAGRRC